MNLFTFNFVYSNLDFTLNRFQKAWYKMLPVCYRCKARAQAVPSGRLCSKDDTSDQRTHSKVLAEMNGPVDYRNLKFSLWDFQMVPNFVP